MIRGKLVRLLLHATALLFCATAISLVAQNAAYVTDPNWVVPPADAVRANPLAGNGEAAGGGRKLFQRHCAECHGEDGMGKKKAANLMAPSVQAQSDGALFWKITNGKADGDMPSFSRLPELQRWQLVLYLRSLVK